MCQDRLVSALRHESAKGGSSWSHFLPSPVSVPVAPVSLCLGQPCLLVAPPKPVPAHISPLAGSLPSWGAQDMVGGMRGEQAVTELLQQLPFTGQHMPRSQRAEEILGNAQPATTFDCVVLPEGRQGLYDAEQMLSFNALVSGSCAMGTANAVTGSIWPQTRNHQPSLSFSPGRGAGAQTQRRQGHSHSGAMEELLKGRTPWHIASSSSRTLIASESTKSLNRPSLQLASGGLWAGSGGKQEQLDALRPLGVAGSGGRERTTLERAAKALVHQLDVQLHAGRTDGSPQKKARTSLLGLDSLLSKPSCLKEAAKLLLEELDRAEEGTGAAPVLALMTVTGPELHKSVGASNHARRNLDARVDKLVVEKKRQKKGCSSDGKRTENALKELHVKRTSRADVENRQVVSRNAIVKHKVHKHVQLTETPLAVEAGLASEAHTLEAAAKREKEIVLVEEEGEEEATVQLHLSCRATNQPHNLFNKSLRPNIAKASFSQCSTNSCALSTSGDLTAVSSMCAAKEENQDRDDLKQHKWPVLFGFPLIPASAGT